MNLQRALTLCVLLLSSANAGAQQQPADVAGAGTFTVVGDVDRPGNFRFDEPLTVRAAVASASPVSDAVNVTVLRNGHNRAQSTRLLRLSTADSGEQALSGDLYVVESLAQPPRPVPPNAVLRTSVSTTVVSLEDAGVVISDVLQGLAVPVNSQTRISIPCRIHGQRSLESAPLSASVRHGDVIAVNGTAALAEDGTPAIRPMVSEWHGSTGRGVGQQRATPRSPVSGRQEVRLPELPAPFPLQPAINPPEAPLASLSIPAATASSASSVGVTPFPTPQGSLSATSPTPGPAAPQLPTLRNSAEQDSRKSSSRVVIVGDPSPPNPRSSASGDVLVLGDSLRVSPAAPVVNSQPKRRQDVRARVPSTEGRNVSGTGSKVPVTAAVSTKREDAGKREDARRETSAEIPAPESLPQAATASSSTIHWAIIAGLFVAGVWILGRSLSVGSAAAIPAATTLQSTPPHATAEASLPNSGNTPSSPVPADSQVPWRIYSVPQAVRPANTPDSHPASADELDLLIANRVPIERTSPQLPQAIELSGRSSSHAGQTIRRVDGPHTVLRGRHAEQPDPAVRRGRPLEERLSQLIRSVPAGAPRASAGSDRATGSTGAER